MNLRGEAGGQGGPGSERLFKGRGRRGAQLQRPFREDHAGSHGWWGLGADLQS